MAAPEITTATLSPEQWDVFTRPVNAKRWGGMQRLLGKLIQRANRERRRVTLTPQDLAGARTYAAYCQGGYKDRFRALLAAVDAR